MACSVVCEAVVSTAMPENDMHLRDYCVIYVLIPQEITWATLQI